MSGTDAITGKPLSGFAHFVQSVRDILGTPIGSRVMRRNYGSNLANLVDNPANPQTLANIYYATAVALMRWEPRISLTRVFCQAITPGQVTLSLTGTYLPNGKTITLDGITIP
jgi:phage baseplate assembly protein W